MKKLQVKQEPVIILANGEMTIRTTITGYINQNNRDREVDIINLINEYHKQYVKIVIEGVEPR